MKFLTSDQLAEVLQVPKATLDKWAYQGRGPRYIRVGRHRRYPDADLERWIEERLAEADGKREGVR